MGKQVLEMLKNGELLYCPTTALVSALPPESRETIPSDKAKTSLVENMIRLRSGTEEGVEN